MVALTFTVRKHAEEDGFGKLTQGDSCVMFKYVGTALTNVRVESGARVAFILLNEGDNNSGCVGTAPRAAIDNRDLGDHVDGLGVYSDGDVRHDHEDLDPQNRLAHILKGDLVVLECLPNMEVQMWLNGNQHYKWTAKEGSVFAVSGTNGTAWKVRQAPSRDAPPPQAPPAPLQQQEVKVEQQQVKVEHGAPSTEADAVPLPAVVPNQELIEASGKGNTKEIQRLIADGVDVRHFAPMHAAARRGHVKVLNLLIEAGADKDVPAVDPQGLSWTPMHTAASNGQVKFVQALIEAGANKDARELKAAMRTPLHMAAFSGHEKVVKALCDAGADKEARTANSVMSSAQTAMHWAVRHPKVLKVLLKAGASDEAVSSAGKTPLDRARALRAKASVSLLEKVEKERNKAGLPAKRPRLS